MTPGQKWYSEARRDPRWQRRRLEIMERDDFTCQRCGQKEKTLNVHHKRYFKGWKPWEYQGCTLVTLCEVCHESEPERMAEFVPEAIETLSAYLTATELARVVGAIGGVDPNLSGTRVAELIEAALAGYVPAKAAA